MNLKLTTNSRTNHSEMVNSYLKDIAKFPILSPEQQANLAVKAQNGDMEARETLFNCNQRFVFAVAKRYCSNESVLDLVNEGNIGLEKCISKFDASKGIAFLSYAVWYIRREINIYLTNNMSIVKKSNFSKTRFYTTKAKDKFFCENGRYPSVDELAEIFKTEFNIEIIDPNDLETITTVSINTSIDSEDTSTFEEVSDFASKTASYNDYERESERDDVKYRITRALSVLKEREQEVIKMAFGLDGYVKEFTNQEIAEELGFTSERVRQIKNASIKKLQVAILQMEKENEAFS